MSPLFQLPEQGVDAFLVQCLQSTSCQAQANPALKLRNPDALPLKVREEFAVRAIICVRDPVSELWTYACQLTTFCHGE